MNERIEISDKRISDVLTEFATRLAIRVNEKGNKSFIGPHESLGVVTEEYFELIEAVKSNNKREVEEELYDVAVAAIWGVMAR